MMSLIVAIALFSAVTILAAVTTYWPDIVAQPPSAAAFLGALAGAGGGLLAIILGALLNAELNRRRDDRLRREETRAIAVALRAELGALEHFVSRGLGTIREWQQPGNRVTVAALTTLAIEEQTIFESVANKLGILGAELTLAIVAPHAKIGRIRTNMDGLKNQGLEKTVPDDIQKIFMVDCQDIKKTSREAIEALDKFIGHRP